MEETKINQLLLIGGSAGSLPVLLEEERQQVLYEWNTTEVEYPREKCVHELFEEQVRKSPGARLKPARTSSPFARSPQMHNCPRPASGSTRRSMPTRCRN